MSRVALSFLSFSLVVVACAPAEPTSSAIDAAIGSDAAAPIDAAVTTDAAAAIDAAPAIDAAMPDAFVPPTPDAGSVTDAGSAADTGTAMDRCDPRSPSPSACCLDDGRYQTGTSCRGDGMWHCPGIPFCECPGDPVDVWCTHCGSGSFTNPWCIDGEWGCREGMTISTECP